MLRRRLPPFAATFLLTALASLPHARATIAVLPSGTAVPLDQRVAIAIGPSRTTIWTNLRLDTANAPVALVVPVPPGAALDHSSDAWFEALDEATAPRVIPPSGTAYVCPGVTPDPMSTPLHATTLGSSLSSVQPIEGQVLLDAPAVLEWANTHGFSVSPETLNTLGSMSNMRFFVERFNPPTAPFVSSTLRIVLPSSSPVLPLALTQASTADLRITAWFIGMGRAALTGSSPVKLQMTDLQWLAQSQTSNYVEIRDGALLATGSTANVTETSSHEALLKNIPIADGKGSITGVITSYFQRAASYSDGNTNPSNCILSAGVALDSTLDVAHACPPATLGIVDGGSTCTEAPSGSEVDPDKLRCGGRADDLAIALSGLRPASTWLTRMVLVVPQETAGQTWPVTFTAVAPEVDPLVTASSISFADCSGTGSSGNSSSGWTFPDDPSTTSSSGGPWTTGNGSGGNPTYDPDYDSDMSCGCGPTPGPVIIDDTGYGGSGGAGGSGGDAYYDDTSSDDCSGDTTESTDPDYEETSSDDCDGDTTESTDPSYDDTSSSDDCDGDTTESSSDSSSDSIDCSGETDGGGGSTDYTESSDSSESSDCTVARHARNKPHKRGPKVSMLTLGLLAILAPLRRWSRPRRRRASTEKNSFSSPRVENAEAKIAEESPGE